MVRRLIGAGLLLALVVSSGCESGYNPSGLNDGYSVAAYYSTGFYDPWYYGGYDNDNDIIVMPPRPDRPDRPVRPEQPIARPPSDRPMPSIPSTPRAAPRGGGGGRR